MNVTLTSIPSTDQGTFGRFVLEDGTTFFSLELPWHDNKRRVSCIPAGVYTCHMINSPKHGECYQVMDVPDRDMIEIHIANVAGDEDKGFIAELLGCITLGKTIGFLRGQLAVINSRSAIEEFEKKMEKKDFQLTIKRG